MANDLDPECRSCSGSKLQGYFWDWPKLFNEKTMSDKVILISFLGPIHKLFKSGVHFAVRRILRFLGPIFFFQMAH